MDQILLRIQIFVLISAVGHPQPTLTWSYTTSFVCPEETVSFTCSSTQSFSLQWIAEPVVPENGTGRAVFTSSTSDSTQSLVRGNITMFRRDIFPLAIEMEVKPDSSFTTSLIKCIDDDDEPATFQYSKRLSGMINHPKFSGSVIKNSTLIEVKWSPSNTSGIDQYLLTCDPECGEISVDSSQVSFTFRLIPDSYVISIAAIDICGLKSAADSITIDVPSPTSLPSSQAQVGSNTGLTVGLSVVTIIAIIAIIISTILLIFIIYLLIKMKRKLHRGPIGYIYHRNSGKRVCPSSQSNRHGDTDLLLCDINDGNSHKEHQVQFIPVKMAGHFGYIKHEATGKIVHPQGGELDPGNNAKLVFHPDQHNGALFAFDEENEMIVHKGGKIWNRVCVDPGETTLCVHSQKHDDAKFYFGNKSGVPISPYPKPTLSGEWCVIKAFKKPALTYTNEVVYKIGRSKTKFACVEDSWSISREMAKKLFEADPKYSSFVDANGNENMWSNEEAEGRYSTTVREGQDKVLWQYVFRITRYDEEWSYKSGIIREIESLSKKPAL